MAKKIMVTVKDNLGNEQKLTPEHADNLMKISKFFTVVNDPRADIKPPKTRNKD